MGMVYSCDRCKHPDKDDTRRNQYALEYFKIDRSDIDGMTEYTTFTPSSEFVQLIHSKEDSYVASYLYGVRSKHLEICKHCFQEILNVSMVEKTSYFVFSIEDQMYFMSILYTDGFLKHK